MLPGQAVNVLNVPMHFSSAHHRHRNASVSSTSSELRTMNPEDKYVNPRPAPTPALARLNTLIPHKSAPNLQSSPSRKSPASGRSSHGRNASLPSSSVSLRSFRLPRKASMDARGRSVSPTHARPTGLRAAFRQLAPTRASSPEAKVERGRPGFPGSHRERLSLDQARRSERALIDRIEKPTSSASSKASSRARSPTPKVGQDLRQAQMKTLALRRSVEQLKNIDAAFSTPSFQNHRGQRSRSREPSPVHKSLISHEQPKRVSITQDANCPQYLPLETLREVASAQNTPIWPSTGTSIRVNEPTGPNACLEASPKHLPNLLSTPSSSLSLNEHPGQPSRDSAKGPAELEDFLSKVTLSDEYPSSTDRSHFSHWTNTTISSFASSQWSSVFLDGKSPSFSRGNGPSSQPTSPWETSAVAQSPSGEKSRERSSVPDANRMPSVISSSTISSYDNASPSSPASETSESAHPLREEPTSLQKRYGMVLGGCQGYKLPIDPQNSQSTIQCHLPWSKDDRAQDLSDDHTVGESTWEATSEDFPHTTNMQQLLDELSYLGDMIQK